jgi:hypothetical protein
VYGDPLAVRLHGPVAENDGEPRLRGPMPNQDTWRLFNVQVSDMLPAPVVEYESIRSGDWPWRMRLVS